jgi:hypothetical protein
MTQLEEAVKSNNDLVGQMKDSNKYLASIVRCEDVIEDLNTYLAFKNSAAVHFYPSQIEIIMDLLIDMKTMVFEYSEAFDKLQDMLEQEQIKNAQWADLFKPQN